MAAVRMNDNINEHIPVLLTEAVDALVTSPDGIYVDATFGRGSHSRAILNKLSAHGRLIAFDKDPVSIAYAKQHIHDARFTIVHSSFANMQTVLTDMQCAGKVAGVLFDLGVSSPQLDCAERGFSFMRDGALDMRMNTAHGMTAAEWLATVDDVTLADVLYRYGDEKFSRRIARLIVETRDETPITTTLQLANLIVRALPKAPWKDKHPATRSFQAIRIFINQELTDLEKGLLQAFNLLAPGGRLSVISFHSLEDRIVKEFIRDREKGKDDLPRGLPVKEVMFKASLKSIGKPIKPSDSEIDSNPRARSAILRVAEKPL
jgi:16S rRNA (cytosine1402-N4)-methyltransferase